MPVTLPETPSHETPVQEGQALGSGETPDGTQDVKTFPSGSSWIPFLNSSRDRRSKSEMAQTSSARERM